MREARSAISPRCLPAWAAVLLLAACNLSGRASFSFGATPEKAAEAVFAKVATGGVDAAYASVSPAFRNLVGPNAWRAFATGMGLERYQDVAWSGHMATARGVRISGLLHAHGALDMPIDVDMSRGPGGWAMDRIHFHRLNTITLGEGAVDSDMPRGEIRLSEVELAAACRQILASQAALDQVICMQATPGVPGASSLCVGITTHRVVGVSARVNAYDPTTRDADISCRITDPDRTVDRVTV